MRHPPYILSLLILSLTCLNCSNEKSSANGDAQDQISANGGLDDQIKGSKIPVILDTDANNEIDDQHAIAYLLFNGNYFNVEGITVNATRNGGDIYKQYEEAKRVVKLCGLESGIDIYKGADNSFKDIKDNLDKPGFDGEEAVNFIIDRAKKKSEGKLILIPVGKLTNVALALKKDPSIASNIRVVWLGSNYPGPGEYNFDNDTAAVNYVLDTEVDFEIVVVRYDKPSGTHAVRASLNEIKQKMPGVGPKIPEPVEGRHGKKFTNFGDYSISLYKNIDLYGNPPARALYDVVPIAIIKNPKWGEAKEIKSPQFIDGRWVSRPEIDHSIVIWENFDREKVIQDFFKSMQDYVLAND